VCRPFLAGDVKRGNRHGERIDGREVQLDVASRLASDLNRVRDARQNRRDLLRGRRQCDRGEAQVLVFPRGRRPGGRW
jgi:hypothetical protein